MSNLTIIMTDPSDAGGYACNVTNVVGQDTATAELTVHGKWLSLYLKWQMALIIYYCCCLKNAQGCCSSTHSVCIHVNLCLPHSDS